MERHDERSFPSARSADKDFCMHRCAEIIVYYQEDAYATVMIPCAHLIMLSWRIALRRALDCRSIH